MFVNVFCCRERDPCNSTQLLVYLRHQRFVLLVGNFKVLYLVLLFQTTDMGLQIREMMYHKVKMNKILSRITGKPEQQVKTFVDNSYLVACYGLFLCY